MTYTPEDRPMPVIDLDKLPPEVLADIRDAAEKSGTTVEAEATARLVTVTDRGPLPPLGEPIPSLEMIAPYHLPLPGPAVKVKVRNGGPLKPATGYRVSEDGE
jgi:hypothetical protein